MAKRPKAVPRELWPIENIEDRALSAMTVNPRNARRHTPEQVAKIAGLIETFGWTQPILVDEAGTILAGEGRYLAAKKLRLKSVSVIVARGWTDAQKRAYAIADNRIAELSSWDDDTLSSELADLAEEFPADFFGWAAKEASTEAVTVREVATEPVADEFWISVRGPLKHQAAMLKALEDAAGPLDDVAVELGTIEDR